MKRNLLMLILAAAVMTACQQKTEQVPVDVAAEKAAIADMFDAFLNGMKTQDVDTMAYFIADDALICGTDPSEFWSKKEIVDGWNQMLSESPVEMKFFGDRTIKVAPDGNSAVAVDQFYIPTFTPNIPWRNVYYLNKTDGKWMIAFMSSALIPENDDLATLNNALNMEESEQ